MSNYKRTALVTGAGGGIGVELVNAFTESGYTVIGTDRVVMPKSLKCATYLKFDLESLVNDEVTANRFFSHVRDELLEDRLDVLVNNAAIQILGGVNSLSRMDWRSSLDINVIAPFLLVQGLVRELERGCGGIINISSIHARHTKENFIAYATTKAAISGLTRAMAVDLGARIRVNAIEPAAIETDMLRAGFENDPDRFLRLESCHPLRRIGKPCEVARLAVSIAEGGFNFMHGACISLDGGIGNKLNDPI
ncbi:SDR family oxidoreductase [Pseudohongiella sp. SYSU M77423]|uniref:SDR family NAD(P)-dependent oxidoreductase n=1 Tax=Pseudohongiella sp. SYSU M77423 TaxID=3042312 RepID=UPI00247FB204|nr:SDR family oxidoreductase [Pseudohongiella sp. SYSU M77423]MDH7944936.1 SDR family oxidoreductase [Pseudohongiella sp. SYSU M77423]